VGCSRLTELLLGRPLLPQVVLKTLEAVLQMWQNFGDEKGPMAERGARDGGECRCRRHKDTPQAAWEPCELCRPLPPRSALQSARGAPVCRSGCQVLYSTRRQVVHGSNLRGGQEGEMRATWDGVHLGRTALVWSLFCHVNVLRKGHCDGQQEGVQPGCVAKPRGAQGLSGALSTGLLVCTAVPSFAQGTLGRQILSW
jgi:hypothetical protein